MTPNISIATILVNYKSEERTIKCIKEELMRCSLTYRIIVVNNGANESSDEVLARELGGVVIYDINIPIDTEQRIFIISNPENSGFARGNNLGVDFATNHFEVDYLLFSNNDIVMRSDRTIESLVEKLASLPDVGVIGLKVVGLDGKCQSPYIYLPFWEEMVFLQWQRFVPFKIVRSLDRVNAQSGYYYRVMGSFFISPTVDYIACGKMDPNTFLYGEEVILAERMLRIGKKNYYEPSIEILHEHGVTISKNKDVFKGRDYLSESMFYYFREYRGVPQFSVFIARGFRQIFNIVRWSFNLLKR